MKRSVLGWIIAAILAFGGAALAYVFFLAGGSGEPSTELTTPELAASSTTASVETSTTADSTDTTAATGTVETAFVIDPELSTVSFQIDEVLRGEPTTVVGTTDQVAGQVVVDPSDLSSSQFSEIVVNARTFETDSSRRDRAIRGPVILNSGSDEHELIIFTPRTIEGLDGLSAAPGETYQFTVTGDLAIRDTTSPVAFDMIVEMVDEATLRGSATTLVLRSDFGIGIPSVPLVSDVGDEVTLTLDFLARAT